MIKDKKRMLDREKFVLWESLKRRAMSTISVYRNDPDFTDLRKNYNKEFAAEWKLSYEAYIKGEWKEAHKLLSAGLKKCPEDGPTKTLLNVIESMCVDKEYSAPQEW